MRKAARLLIHGRVQGVYFRQGTREQARRRGISGWVRNLPDGSVEALLEGEELDLREMIEWCSHGPPGARVDEVKVEWLQPTGELSDFHIRYDAY